jgi:3(or 17)beta-hydroxysteroid dehydrogenase
MKRVEGKTAIVTGAALGLGRATALMLAREGARLVLTDVREAEGMKLRDEIVAGGDEAIFIRHDVASEADWISVMQAAEARFGGVDVLVNNAGVLFSSKIEETPLEKWRWLMSVNCDGVFLGVKHAIRAMKARGGSIINLSSVAGLVGLPEISAYCASKGAVALFTKAAALECARAGYAIRVNSIHPAASGRQCSRSLSASAASPAQTQPQPICTRSVMRANPTTSPTASSIWPRRKANSSPDLNW